MICDFCIDGALEESIDIHFIEPGPAGGDSIKYRVCGEVVFSVAAELRIVIGTGIPLRHRPLARVEDIRYFTAGMLAATLLVDYFEDILHSCRRGGVRYYGQMRLAIHEGRAVEEIRERRVFSEFELDRIGLVLLAPIGVAPVPAILIGGRIVVQIDLWRIFQIYIDLVGELRRVNLALDSPRLIAERLLTAARDIRDVLGVIGHHVVFGIGAAERADISEEDNRLYAFGHYDFVYEEAYRLVVLARISTVIERLIVAAYLDIVRHESEGLVVIRTGLVAVHREDVVRNHPGLYVFPLAGIAVRCAVKRNRGVCGIEVRRRSLVRVACGAIALPSVVSSLEPDFTEAAAELWSLHERHVLLVNFVGFIRVDVVCYRVIKRHRHSAGGVAYIAEIHSAFRVVNSRLCIVADRADVPAPPTRLVDIRLVGAAEVCYVDITEGCLIRNIGDSVDAIRRDDDTRRRD